MATDRRGDDLPWYVGPRPWYILPTLSQNLGPFIFVCIIGSNLLHNAKRHQHVGWWGWAGLVLVVVGVVVILVNVTWHLARLWRGRRAGSSPR